MSVRSNCPPSLPARRVLEPEGVLETLVRDVVGRERGDLRPLHREVRGPAERSEGLHEQLVPLELVECLAERLRQTGDSALAQLRLAQGRRIDVDGLAGIELPPDAVE